MVAELTTSTEADLKFVNDEQLLSMVVVLGDVRE
jgi:hypothetical protein